MVHVSIRASGDVMLPKERDALEHALDRFLEALVDKAPNLVLPRAPMVSGPGETYVLLKGTEAQHFPRVVTWEITYGD